MSNLREKFDLKNTIRAIETYNEKCFFETKDVEYKPFYKWDEWEGWRFYKRALLNWDWKSIVGHVNAKIKRLREEIIK